MAGFADGRGVPVQGMALVEFTVAIRHVLPPTSGSASGIATCGFGQKSARLGINEHEELLSKAES